MRALHHICPNMAYSQKQLETTLLEMGREKAFFKDQPSVCQQWAATCALRLRRMSRHFAQAIIKARGSRSSWIRLVLNPPKEARLAIRSSEILRTLDLPGLFLEQFFPFSFNSAMRRHPLLVNLWPRNHLSR